MAAGGTDLLHLKRLTWDAIEAQTPPTAARLAEELTVPVKSVCEWLDGESNPADAQILAMIKMTRASEQQRPSETRPSGRSERPSSTEGEVPGDDRQSPC